MPVKVTRDDILKYNNNAKNPEKNMLKNIILHHNIIVLMKNVIYRIHSDPTNTHLFFP